MISLVCIAIAIVVVFTVEIGGAKRRKVKREAENGDALEWEQNPELKAEMDKDWEDWEDPKIAMERRRTRGANPMPSNPDEVLAMLNKGGGVMPNAGPKMVFVEMAPHIQGSKRRVDEAGHKWINLLQTGGVSCTGVAIDEKQYLINMADGTQMPEFAQFMRPQEDCWEFQLDNRPIPCGNNPKNLAK